MKVKGLPLDRGGGFPPVFDHRIGRGDRFECLRSAPVAPVSG
jgi:hypothetical protein